MLRPLNVLDLSKFVHNLDLDGRGESRVSSISPLRVMNHPSSRSHIARTSVSRLEKDIVDFSTDENSGTMPILNAVNRSTALQGPALDKAVADVTVLIGSLTKLRDSDGDFVKAGIADVVQYCNGKHPVHQNNTSALGHVMRQAAHYETSLVSFLFCFE